MSEVPVVDVFGSAAAIWREAQKADIPPEVRGQVLAAAAVVAGVVIIMGAANYFGRSIKLSFFGMSVDVKKDD
jgi:hypothetical protein